MSVTSNNIRLKEHKNHIITGSVDCIQKSKHIYCTTKPTRIDFVKIISQSMIGEVNDARTP